MKQFTTVKYGIVFLLLIPVLSLGAGKLKGKIEDAQSKDPLIGANVLLVGTSVGAVSDIYGNYLLPAVAPGKYTVRCSYLGYVLKTAPVTITDGATSEVNFALTADVLEGQEVVISAQAFGQAAAINQQLSSNTIVNVISEQKIKELPDANAAEAIGRLPGVSVVRSGGEASQIMLRGLGENMMTITVDGVKLSPTDANSRGVDLSAIAQSSLSGIEVSKAVTSDMDGEAIAGRVNFVTKIAPEQREIQLNLYGMYNGLDKNTSQYNLIGRYGDRFFDGVMGVQLFGNIEKRDRSSEEYDVSYYEYQKFQYYVSSFGVRYTPETRQREGGKVLLDFKTPDEGILKINGELNRTKRNSHTIFRNYPYSREVNYSFNGQDLTTDIRNVALQGENHLFDWNVNWNLSYTESKNDNPYNFTMNYGEDDGMNGIVPVDYQRSANFLGFISFARNNFQKTSFNTAQAETNSSLDFEKTAFADIKREYNAFNLNGEIKFGGKYRSKYHRRFGQKFQALYYLGNNDCSLVRAADGSIVNKDFAAYGFPANGFAGMAMDGGLILLPNFLSTKTYSVFDKYLLNGITDPNRARAWYEMSKNGVSASGTLEFEPDASSSGSNYNLIENVSSEYIMNTLRYDDLLTLITGVRFEQDANNYNALYSKSAVTAYAAFHDTTAEHTETIVLPNIQAIYKPTNFMNIRAAVYRGINRPDFNLRLPTFFYGKVGDSYNIVSANTKLKNADAWNYEANVQFYGNGVGLLSLSAFYKKINNLVTNLNGVRFTDTNAVKSYDFPVIPNLPLSNLFFWKPYNCPEPTKVWGFELEHQANLRFLPGYLSNIVLGYNITLSKTETFVTDVTYGTVSVFDPQLGFPVDSSYMTIGFRKSRIPSTPEWFGNLSLGYDIGGFSARMSYFYQKRYLNTASSDGYTNYYQKSFSRFDLSLKQELTSMLTVGLNVNNITNLSEGAIQANSVYVWEGETSGYRYGTAAELWLQVTL
ncbi:MAG TPA: TonB-dependent receptor [Bacteroidota bacterium]|nr:TonB-dependent receptor [Bacteroidota bacterium]